MWELVARNCLPPRVTTDAGVDVVEDAGVEDEDEDDDEDDELDDEDEGSSSSVPDPVR